MKRVERFSIEYYKPSGKLYASDDFECEVRIVGEPPHETVSMYDAVDHVRGRLIAGDLPGLTRGAWEGHIRVDHENGYPCLIPNVLETDTIRRDS